MVVSASTETIPIPFLKDPATVWHEPSGHTIIYVRKPGGVFNLSTWVKTGSIHEDEANSGVSHFLEHLMFKGTERCKPGEFDRAMESMGAIINAATWKDFTFYYITAPKGSSGQNFAKALDMHADMLLHSTLPEAEIGPQYNPDDPDYTGEKRERAVVIEEIGMREDQPWNKIFNAVNAIMYPTGHPYQRDVIGTRQIIGNIPRDAILDYYRRWYSAPNMTTLVVGEFEPEALHQQVRQAFDFSHRAGFTQGQALTDAGDPRASGERHVVLTGDVQTAFFMMGFHGPSPQQLKDTIAIDVFSYVLGEGRSSRLNQTLVEQPAEPIFTTVSSGQSTFKLGNTFYIQGNFISPDVDDALGQVRAELERLLDTDPMTEDEFQRAVKKLKVDFAETSETAAGISETLGESITMLNHLGLYTDYLTTLATLDVETVRETARRLLAPDLAYTSVLVPAHA